MFYSFMLYFAGSARGDVSSRFSDIENGLTAKGKAKV